MKEFFLNIVKKPRKKIRFYNSLFAEYKARALLLLVLMTLSSLMQGLSMALILPVLESIISGQLNNKFSKLLIPLVSSFDSAYWPLITTLVFFLFTLVKVILQVYNKYYEVKFINDLSLGWKLQLFKKYLQSSYSYVIDHKQGELIYNLDTEAKKAGNLMIYYIDYIYLYFAFFFQYIVLLAASVRITMIISLLFAGMYTVVVVLGKRYLHGLGRKLIRVSQTMSSLSVESIAAIRQIKLFSMEKNIIDRYTRIGKKKNSISLKTDLATQTPVFFVDLIIAIFFVGIIIYATFSQKMDIRHYLPVVGLFTIVAERLAELGRKMFNKKLLVHNLWPSLDLVLNIINAPVNAEIVDNGHRFIDLEEDIVFDNVCFGYHPEHPVLENLNITIPKGKMTALVGPSGCGKSTIADLLVRMYDVTSGRILLNGRDIREYSLGSLRYRTGFVSQDTFIFNATVRENILVGNPSASEQDLLEAARLAHCLEFIEKMPLKWETIVGDRGTKLSGGQRQRLAIARAIIRRPAIYVFDEATSALDHVSEKLIQKSIEDLSEDNTVIVIAHRLSTIENADVLHDLALVNE